MMGKMLNRRLFCAVCAMLGCGLVAAADGPVRNGDFANRTEDGRNLPLDWQVPPDSPWHSTNADGHSGQNSLQARLPARATVGPAVQETTLAADTDYVLRASFKSDGRLKPLVRILAVGEPERELARVACPAVAHQWQAVVTPFNSGDATRVVVEIWVDANCIDDRAAPAGLAGIDAVRILPAKDAAEELAAQIAVPAYENLALGRPYTMNPPPGYRHCTDPGDTVQLTDGEYTVGYFWTQKSTVGWSSVNPVIITLDLGDHYPIRGFSYNTAAGIAGVTWPAAIDVLVSVDGRAYHAAGDLVALVPEEARPAPHKYAVYRYRTDGLRVHGRYVRFIIDPAGPYCFVDEIEVYRGQDEWRDLPLPGPEVRYPMEYFADNPFNAAIKRRIGVDCEQARAAVLAADLPPTTRQRLMAEVESIQAAIGELPQYEAKDFRAVFPLNDVHARVYALQGAVREALGHAPLIAWGTNPWDFLAPAELPAEPPAPRIEVAAMRGEVRAGAVNVTNCTARPMALTVHFEDVPGGVLPEYITVHEVAWTDTRQGTAVAAALPQTERTDGAWAISAPAGMTRQIWLTVQPINVPAGEHRGLLVIGGETTGPIRVPFTLRVFDLTFPEQPALHVGGWDYTNTNMYGVTAQNRDALIAHLQSRFVDSPWATSGVMPFGTFDDNGEFQAEPATAAFDAWHERWPQARRYCVFSAVRGNIAGTPIDDPLFGKKVGTWIRFWAAHVRKRGIDPGQLFLLLVDEPSRHEQDRIIIAWARAIKAAAPEVMIWEDPIYRDPSEALPEMMALCDVLCPNRPMMLREGKAFEQFYRQQKQAGRRLDFYSCSGPARLLDPYAYHRLQAWTCFEVGAEASFFWAFGDTGGGHSWNEYAVQRTSYTPLFLGPDSVTAGKHMEAIRESVGDFEYLTMLRDRIEHMAKANPRHPALPAARTLLNSATQRVLEAEGVNELKWQDAKDRGIADTVRIEVATVLERLR